MSYMKDKNGRRLDSIAVADAAASVTLWTANTAYKAGQAVVSPSGQVVTAKATFTSGATYSAANWNVTPVSGQFALSVPGQLTVGAGVSRYPIPSACTITGVTAALATAANKDVILDINRNGTSIYADANNRPKILAGARSAARAAVSVAVSAGDYITVDRDQIGGPAAPTFIARTDKGPAGNVQSSTLTRPAGAAVNDIHIAGVWLTVGGAAGSTTEPTTVVTTPTGWTRIGSGPIRDVHNAAARDQELHLFWWRDDGSQATWTFTATQPTTNAYLGADVVTYRGCIPTGNPVDVFATATPAASGTTWNIPAVVTTAPGDVIISLVATPNAVTSPVYPAGETARTGLDASFLFSDTIAATAGTVAARDLTGSTNPSSRDVTATIALLANPSGALPGADLTVVIDYSA